MVGGLGGGGITSIVKVLLQIPFAVQRPIDFHLYTKKRSCRALPQIWAYKF